MMRFYRILFFLFFPTFLFGQSDFIKKKTLAKNDSLGIQVIKIGDTLRTDYFLIYNGVDSILFHSENYRFNIGSSEYDGITIEKPIQFGNIGNNEIILYHVHNNFPKVGVYNKTLFIINLDTKQKIFQGKYNYDNGLRTPGTRSTYSYDISFDNKGNLIIEYDDDALDGEPDQQEGIYSLIDGKYTWIKSQYKYTRKIIAKNDSLGIKVVRMSNCEKSRNAYFLFFSDEDSIRFYAFGNRCIEDDPFDFRESGSIKSIQLDQKGNPEIIVEYEYSGGHTYTGYHREIIIINLDSMEVIFRKEIEALGQHFYGEELGDHYGFKYEISYTDEGDIIIKKPSDISDGYLEERYMIIEGKHVLQKIMR